MMQTTLNSLLVACEQPLTTDCLTVQVVGSGCSQATSSEFNVVCIIRQSFLRALFSFLLLHS
jgi:hypothetical protein